MAHLSTVAQDVEPLLAFQDFSVQGRAPRDSLTYAGAYMISWSDGARFSPTPNAVKWSDDSVRKPVLLMDSLMAASAAAVMRSYDLVAYSEAFDKVASEPSPLRGASRQ